MNVYCHDNASRFVYILSRGQRYRNYVVPDDFIPLVQDVVDTHPGLTFLKEATEFHSRYVHTVIARIFYSVNRSWSGKISISELKRSDLLEVKINNWDKNNYKFLSKCNLLIGNFNVGRRGRHQSDHGLLQL